MDHSEHTSGRIAHNPSEAAQELPIIKQHQPPEGLVENKAGVPQQSNKLLDWFSGWQERMRANPTPVYMIGLGLTIGGLAVAWARQRKRSILMRDFSGVARQINPKGRDTESLPDVGL